MFVCGQKCAHFASVSVANRTLYTHLSELLYLYCRNKMLVCRLLTLLLFVICSSAANLLVYPDGLFSGLLLTKAFLTLPLN